MVCARVRVRASRSRGGAALWWSYFDFASRAARGGLLRSVRSGALARNVYSWGHFPVAVGLTLLGAGTELAILDSADGTLGSAARWALCGGVALYIVAICVIVASLARSARALWWPRGPTAMIVVGLAAFGGSLSALVVVAALAGVLVAQVLLEIVLGAAAEAPEGQPAAEPTTA